MKIYESLYMKLNYFASESLLNLQWNSQFIGLSDEIYKKELLECLFWCKKLRPKKIFIDFSRFNEIPSWEIREWALDLFFPTILRLSTKKVAICVKYSELQNFDIRQTFSNENSLSLQTRYFHNETQAAYWLGR